MPDFGLFLTWLYVGSALIPMAAGTVARVAGASATAMLFVGAETVASILPVLLLRPAGAVARVAKPAGARRQLIPRRPPLLAIAGEVSEARRTSGN